MRKILLFAVPLLLTACMPTYVVVDVATAQQKGLFEHRLSDIEVRGDTGSILPATRETFQRMAGEAVARGEELNILVPEKAWGLRIKYALEGIHPAIHPTRGYTIADDWIVRSVTPNKGIGKGGLK